MEPTEPVYDSITSGALRMARRHWYVLAIGAVAGLLAGLFLGGSGASWTADADVRILFESVAPRDSPEGRWWTPVRSRSGSSSRQTSWTCPTTRG
ncbi:MAG: hypothetical protein R2716_12730 [Microthrixaceae bacterium]